MCVPLTRTRVYILVGESCANELFYLIKKKKSKPRREAAETPKVSVALMYPWLIQHELLGQKMPQGTPQEMLSSLSLSSQNYKVKL